MYYLTWSCANDILTHHTERERGPYGWTLGMSGLFLKRLEVLMACGPAAVPPSLRFLSEGRWGAFRFPCGPGPRWVLFRGGAWGLTDTGLSCPWTWSGWEGSFWFWGGFGLRGTLSGCLAVWSGFKRFFWFWGGFGLRGTLSGCSAVWSGGEGFFCFLGGFGLRGTLSGCSAVWSGWKRFFWAFWFASSDLFWEALGLEGAACDSDVWSERRGFLCLNCKVWCSPEALRLKADCFFCEEHRTYNNDSHTHTHGCYIWDI